VCDGFKWVPSRIIKVCCGKNCKGFKSSDMELVSARKPAYAAENLV